MKNKKNRLSTTAERVQRFEYGAEFAVALFTRKAWRQENARAVKSKRACRGRVKGD